MLAALGLMRLSTAPDRDEGRALATIEAALEAGVRLFDTAPSYALGEDDLHHNERLLGRAIRASRVPRAEITVVTKTGLTRRGTSWSLDGRASAIRALSIASQDALETGIDVLLLHAIDPKTKLETSVRALEALRAEGVTKAIGVSNAGHNGLAAAAAVATLTAIEERIGAFDDRLLRSGLVAEATRRNLLVLGHTPLGTASRARKIDTDPVLSALANEHETTPGTLVLAWLHHHGVVPLAGATRPETAALAARAATLELSDDVLDRIAVAIDARPRAPVAAAPHAAGEIVLVMGIPGAGKSQYVKPLALGGHQRLNRDEHGGSLKKLHQKLDAALSSGGSFVLDNTYGSRALREEVIAIGRRHGVPVRCVWIDTPIAEAQENVCHRMLDRYGVLLAGAALASAGKDDPNVFLPTVQHRYLKALEPPSDEEGFFSIHRVPFYRVVPFGARPGRIVALELEPTPSDLPTLAIGWSPPDAPVDPALVARATAAGFDVAVCEHGAGPPTCWCRPPLPGLAVRWMRERHVDRRETTFFGTSTTHRTLAKNLHLKFELKEADGSR